MAARSALIVATNVYSDDGLTMLRAPGLDAAALADVLGDVDIGGFDVQSVINEPAHEITRSIARFFAERHPDDLLLLHLSCHGVKDDSGELYFAAHDTSLGLLEATAVSSSFVNRVMERSRAGRVLLLLDCCYSGAFARGLTTRAGVSVDVNERLGGKGRAVITASSALQFAFEGQRLTSGDLEVTEPSVFTSALVRGLRTGDADRDRDGWVSLDELYAYVHDEVVKVTPHQTPKKWTFDVQGDLYVARRARPVTEPSKLPPEIAEAMNSLVPWTRQGVVEPLAKLLNGPHPGLALGARRALEQMASDDDSDRVKQAARDALASASTAEDAMSATPVDQLAAAPPAKRRSLPVLVGLGLAVVALLVGALLMRGDGTPNAPNGAQQDPGSSAKPSATPPAPGGAALSELEFLITRGNGDGTSDLLAVHTETGARRVLVDDLRVSNPKISVDRTWMVYLQGGTGALGKPVLAHPDGTARAPLMPVRDDCVATGRPAWSHDGSRLAVVCFDADDTSTGLRIVTREGEVGPRLVTSTNLRQPLAWTGDDTLVYGISTRSRGPVTLMEVAADGSAFPHQLLASEGYWVSQVDWSEEGLLFIRARAFDAAGDVWLLDPDGGLTQYSDEGDITSVSWTPDGQGAIYTTGKAPTDPDQTVWLQIDEGGEAQELMAGPFGSPSWASH